MHKNEDGPDYTVSNIELSSVTLNTREENILQFNAGGLKTGKNSN